MYALVCRCENISRPPTKPRLSLAVHQVIQNTEASLHPLASHIYHLVPSKPTKSHPTTTTRTLSLRLLLQQLRNLHLHIEELGCATINADALSLIELAFTVFARNALLH